MTGDIKLSPHLVCANLDRCPRTRTDDQAPVGSARAKDLSGTDKNLDFLRAFAVLMVVGGHVLAFFGMTYPIGLLRLDSLGTLGVDIFFVHTSLVLMQSLSRQPGTVPFLIRRVFRIYPLAITVIALVIILHIPQAEIAPHHFIGCRPDGGDVLSNLFLVQDFSYRVAVLGPAWSLTYELGMYLLLPLLFWFARPVNRTLLMYFGLLGACVSLSNVLAVKQCVVLWRFLHFMPCFLPGIVAYELMKTKHSRLPAFCWPIFVIGASALCAMGTGGYRLYAFSALLGLAIPRFKQITSRVITVASHNVAKYSYGIYLTHFASIYLAFEYGARLPLAVRVGLFVALFVFFPIALYHCVEEPLIRLGKRVASSYAHSGNAQDRAARYAANASPDGAVRAGPFLALPPESVD